MGNIEKALGNTTYKNEYQKAIANIFYTCRWMEYYYQQHLGLFGITWQQFYALRILKILHPLPANLNLLKEKMIDKNSDVSRIVERLRKMSMVERKLNKKDRRHVDITITKKGMELLDKIKKRDHEIESVLHNLPEKEVKQLNKLLDKIFEGKV
ncbi:MAG: MarR family transcriptional regulator [Chitinophagaceae bacterium]|nr:MarR family transcriptional regulator [Chitinophagaceae bacterium]